MKEELEIDIKTGGAKRSILDVRKELKLTKDQMLDLSGDEFLQAAKKAGELEHLLKAVNEAVSGASADFGDMVGNIAKAGAGITGAFQAAQGALNLFGVESENVTEAIAKMQNLMAMTQGLASIDEGIKSFSKLKTVIGLNNKELGGFKKALIGTGLGALVVVLGSIIANWDEFTKEIGLSSELMNKLGEITAGVTKVIMASTKSIATAFAKLLKGDFKGAINEVKDGFDIRKWYDEGVTAHKEEIKAKAIADAREIMKAAMEARWEEYYKELEREADQNMVQEILDKLWESADTGPTLHTLMDFILPDEDEEEDLDEWLANQKQKIQDARDVLYMTLQESAYQLADVADQFDQLSAGWGTGFEALGNSIGFATNAVLVFGDENATAAQKAQAGLQAAAATAQGIGNILGAVAKEQDKNTKEGFEKSKKLQIAQATMNMLAGILGAWQSAMALPAPASFILGAILTAATAAMGIAQIVKLKLMKFDSGSTPSAGSAAASLSSAATSLAAPVQYTQDIQGASIEESIRDTRVYVTESDISNTQKKVEVAESESRF